MWDVKHGQNVHAGPLDGVNGCVTRRVGRMIDNPEQAAYVVGEYDGIYLPCVS